MYGLIRNLDSLGRLVIPSEIRKELGIDVSDPMEISVRDGGIFIRLHDEKSVLDAFEKDYLATTKVPKNIKEKMKEHFEELRHLAEEQKEMI